MNRQEVIKEARTYLALAADIIADYIETHEGEQLQTLCKEIDPDNWAALRSRVNRTFAARKADNSTTIERSERYEKDKVVRAKTVLATEPQKVLAAMTQRERLDLASTLQQQIKAETGPKKEHERGGLDAAVSLHDMKTAVKALFNAEPGFTSDVRSGTIPIASAEKVHGELAMIVSLVGIAVKGEGLSLEEYLA